MKIFEEHKMETRKVYWGIALGMLLSIIARTYSSHVHLSKAEIGRLRACAVYGPTANPRPSDEWCEKNESLWRARVSPNSGKHADSVRKYKLSDIPPSNT